MKKILLYQPQYDVGQLNPALFGDADLISKSKAKEFQAEVDRSHFDVIFLELNSGNAQNLELLEYAHKKSPYTPIIITSKSERADTVVDAMNRGASDFLVHPLTEARLLVAMHKAIESKEQKFEIDYHRRKQDVVYDFRDVVALSDSMKTVLSSLEKFAQTDSTILITGETGTGKSFLSGTVHFNSPRKKKPFVKINCANIPEALLESELFGHEAGAFTGAQKKRIGKLEHAQGGTVFLDEIESMPLDLQAKLLRAIEQRSIERLGSNTAIPLDIRFVAASKADLAREAARSKFREDLYYRLNVITLAIPPLNARRDDIPLLFFHLAREARARYRREIPDMTPELEAELISRDWPGNVRELRNIADRWVLGLWEGFGAPVQRPLTAMGDGALSERMAQIERAILKSELEAAGGNLKAVYEKLKISRKGLYDKLRKHGLSADSGV
jgi:two-component system C4-dicarboxylate transport response regulator DctD